MFENVCEINYYNKNMFAFICSYIWMCKIRQHYWSVNDITSLFSHWSVNDITSLFSHCIILVGCQHFSDSRCLSCRRHSLYWDAEENFLQSSVDAILGYMTEVVDCIVRSVPSCPLALRIVLRNVYLQASAKWPCCTHEVRWPLWDDFVVGRFEWTHGGGFVCNHQCFFTLKVFC